MALSPSFTLSGTSDPSSLTLTDTSTGTDGAVVGRKINLYDVSNNLFGSSPYDFPNFPGTTSITINPFLKDKSINVVVTWVDNVGTVLYTASKIYASTGYGEQFYSGLTRNLTSQPGIANDQQFRENFSWLRTLLDSTVLAINNMQDIIAAQNCIDQYNGMIQNQNDFF